MKACDRVTMKFLFIKGSDKIHSRHKLRKAQPSSKVGTIYNRKIISEPMLFKMQVRQTDIYIILALLKIMIK